MTSVFSSSARNAPEREQKKTEKNWMAFQDSSESRFAVGNPRNFQVFCYKVGPLPVINK